MQINIEAEDVRLWVNPHERTDGSIWYTYSISTSSKDKETGDYTNKSLEVKMTKDVQLPDDLTNGELVTIRGTLSNRTFPTKDGQRTEHMIWAREVEFNRQKPMPKSEPADSFSALEDDIPF